MDLYQFFITYNKAWTQREAIAFAVIFIPLAAISFVRVRQKKISVWQMVSFLSLVAYVALILGSCVFTRNPRGYHSYELELFWSWKRVAAGSSALLLENLLNIAMLVPVGVLLPGVWGKRVHWWQALLVGCFISAWIETLQLFLCRGLFEWDDMVHNSLGCLLGCLAANLLVDKR